MVWRFRLDDGTIHEEPENVSYDVALQRARRANDPDSVNSTWLGDMGDALESGAIGVGESLGGIVDLLPAGQTMNAARRGLGQSGTFGGDVTNAAREMRRQAQASRSPEAVETAERAGIFGIRGATLENLPFLAAESAPGTALSFATGGGSRLAGASAGVAKLVGAGTEGLLGAGGVGNAVEEAIRDFAATDPEEFMASQYGREALEATDGNYAEAVELAAQRAKGVMPLLAGGITAAIGAGVGTNVFAGPASKGFIRAILSGAGREGLEEALQSGQEQFATNVDVRNVNEDQNLMEGVPESAVIGGMLGAGMGGGLGTIQETASRLSRQPAPVTPPQQPTAGPAAAPAAPAAPQPQPGTIPPQPAPAAAVPPEDIEADEQGEDDPIVALGVDELANSLGFAEPTPPSQEGVRERRVEEVPLYNGMDRTEEDTDPLVQGVYAGALKRGESVKDTATFQAYSRLESGLYGALPPNEGQQPAAMGYKVVDILEDGSERITYSQTAPEDVAAPELKLKDAPRAPSADPVENDDDPYAGIKFKVGPDYPLFPHDQIKTRYGMPETGDANTYGEWLANQSQDKIERILIDAGYPIVAFHSADAAAESVAELAQRFATKDAIQVKESDIIPPKKGGPLVKTKTPETIDTEFREIIEGPGVPVGKPTSPKGLQTRKQLPSKINNHLRELYAKRADALATEQYIEAMPPMQAKAVLKALGGKNVVGDNAQLTKQKLRRALPRALSRPLPNSVFADIQEMFGAVKQQPKTKAKPKTKPKKTESDTSGVKKSEAKPEAIAVEAAPIVPAQEQKPVVSTKAPKNVTVREQEPEPVAREATPDAPVRERSLEDLAKKIVSLDNEDTFDNDVAALNLSKDEIGELLGAYDSREPGFTNINIKEAAQTARAQQRKTRRSSQTPDEKPAKEKAKPAAKERTASDIRKDREAKDTGLARSMVLNQPSMEDALYEAEQYVLAERARSDRGLKSWTTQRELDLMNKIKGLYGNPKSMESRFKPPKASRSNAAYDRKWSADMQEAIKAAAACAAAQVAAPWTGMAVGALGSKAGGYLSGATGTIMGLIAAPLVARGATELIDRSLNPPPPPGIPFSEAVDENGYINEFAMPSGDLPEDVVQPRRGIEPATAPERRDADSEDEAQANRELDRLVRDYVEASR